MPALTHPQPPRLRGAVAVCLVLVILSLLGSAYAYRRAMRRIDRRLAHNALFAARPRPQYVRAPLGRGNAAHLLVITSSSRSVRRLPAYDSLPPELISAVIAIEDRQYFDHKGVNYLRTTRCAVEDTLAMHMACGGSTLTQQLARAYFLSPQKTLRRKLEEILIARRMEERLTKQQIFVMYIRTVSFGQNNNVAVKGFDQAARVYFGKNIHQLDLAQDALLAGMIHAPNFDNPYRHPERALARRNVVLDSMVQTGAITRAEADLAKAEPLNLATLHDPTELLPASTPAIG